MQRLFTAGLLALALAAASSDQATASGCGPFGFTVGFNLSGSCSFYCAPGCPAPACGSGCFYPGYTGCCSNGMLPAYAYMGGDPGYYGGNGYAPSTAQPAPASTGTDSNDTKSSNAPRQFPAPQRPVYPQQGVAFYPYGGYQAPSYWYGQ
jgi:hypothetical protein